MVPRGRSQLAESFVWLVPLARIDRLTALSRWVMVHRRSSLVESLVWLNPSLCEEREEREEVEEK